MLQVAVPDHFSAARCAAAGAGAIMGGFDASSVSVVKASESHMVPCTNYNTRALTMVPIITHVSEH